MSTEEFCLAQHLQGCISANVPLVLFIGTEVREISKEIIDFPWSCVVTTQAYSDLAVLFREEGIREVEELDNLAALENRRALSRRNLRFIHLFNTNETVPGKRNRRAKDILKIIAELVRSSFGSLIIIGYNFKDKKELPSDYLADILYNARRNSVFMFSTPSWAEDENLQDIVNSGILFPFENSLEDHLKKIGLVEENEEDELNFGENDNILFIENKPVSIDKTQLFATQSFATLLSSAEMNAIEVPVELQREYFSKFLTESVSRPMWFGYKYNFNLQRTFEKELNDRVENALKNVDDRESQGLFVVSGQTGSSKSIALAHLAFNIYHKKKYPVIFIFDKNISFKEGEGNFNALEKLVHLLENKGARTVLIIWDNSAAYTDPIPGAQRLLRGLRRRGRQCVLICSAYMVINTMSEEFKNKGIRIERINTEINLSEKETRQLRQNVLQFGSIDASQYDTWVRSEENQNLLTLLYSLFTETLGNPLADGVGTEVSQTADTFLNFLSNHNGEFPKSINSMAYHLRNAGLAVHKNSYWEENLRSREFKEFFQIIAVASQFGIEMPLQFALSVSGLGKLENGFLYTIRMLQMVPSLRLPERSEDSRSNYGQSILFRTPLEARLYLERGVTAEDEINLVVKLIDTLHDEHRYMEAIVLELLIRTMGPNSPLRKKEIQIERIYKYQPYYDRIIDALSRMRTERKVIIPRLMCQEVSWIREVFGKYSNISDSERIKKLNEAIDIAERALNKIKPGILSGEEQITQNNLIVEKATSVWQIYQLERKGNDRLQELPYNYDQYRNALENIIYSMPDNGYAYNALMKLFIGMYETLNNTEYTINELSNILSMLDSHENIMGDIAYEEEFIRHKKDILQFVSNDDVEIYLLKLIENQRPSGLYLWAKRRLMTEDINLDERVPTEKHVVLKEIASFFTRYMGMVKAHGGCLFLLLRLKWQLFNGSPIFEKEKQVTRMSRQQWQELAEICRGGTYSHGSVAHLLYISALVEAQVGNYRGSLVKQEELQRTTWLPPRSTYVWHILCEEDGSPRLFSGRIEKRETALRIINVRETGNNSMRIDKKIFSNIHSLHVLEPIGTFNDIEIGLNFKGFQAFRKLRGN